MANSTPKQPLHTIRFVASLAGMYALSALMFVLITRPTPPSVHLALSDYAVHAEPKLAMRPRPAIQGLPTHLSVPSLSIELPVKSGNYNADTANWTIDHSAAFHANISMPINESNGTTLVYAHAQSGLFDTLPRLTPGAQAIVASDTGHTFTYTYVSMTETVPSDTSVFRSDGPPTLVLQTCAGEWSQYRDLYAFRLTGVS